MQRDVRQDEAAQGLPATERELVQQVGVVVYENMTVVKGDVVLGEKTDIHARMFQRRRAA